MATVDPTEYLRVLGKPQVYDGHEETWEEWSFQAQASAFLLDAAENRTEIVNGTAIDLARINGAMGAGGVDAA